MVKLSDRLQCIADFIKQGETAADIGTDHGFLPIYLHQQNICPKVILSDINEGPLQKARGNITKHRLSQVFDLRRGGGLETVEPGEVDDVVIAGMGGLLIADILAHEPEKTNSFKKFILQPRNAPEKLKGWLLSNNFVILDESLVRERKYLWEIILASPWDQQEYYRKDNPERTFLTGDMIAGEIDLELNPILFKKRDPLLSEFIQNKIRIEERILKRMDEAGKGDEDEKLLAVRLRITELNSALSRAAVGTSDAEREDSE